MLARPAHFLRRCHSQQPRGRVAARHAERDPGSTISSGRRYIGRPEIMYTRTRTGSKHADTLQQHLTGVTHPCHGRRPRTTARFWSTRVLPRSTRPRPLRIPRVRVWHSLSKSCHGSPVSGCIRHLWENGQRGSPDKHVDSRFMSTLWPRWL